MKRFLAIWICIAVCFSGITALSAEYPDTVDLDCEKAADVLLHFGIMYPQEDGFFNPTGVMSRAEAVVTMLRLINAEIATRPTAQKAEKTYFADVSTDYWAVEDINIAFDLGIISASDDGSFRPDDTVTYYEFIKMLVETMGFGIDAEEAGGYPHGYISVATKKDLLLGITPNEKAELTRNDIAVMLYQALHVNAPAFKGAKGDMAIYDMTQSLVEQAFGYTRKQGIITANSQTGLSGSEATSSGYIKVDGILFRAENEAIGELLGKKVEYYAGTKNGENFLKYATELGMENNVEVLSHEVDYSYEEEERRYVTEKANGTERYIYISKTADIIYNGKAYNTCPANDMKPVTGSVTLIDNDNNRQYDVVIIKSYETGMFEVYDSQKNILYSDKIDPIDLSKIVELKMVFADGKERTLNELYKNSILSIAKSMDGELCEIVVCSDYVSGTIETYKQNTTQDVLLTINGTEYEVSPEAYSRNFKPEAGLTGVFYLDFSGRIVAFSYADGKMSYGYLRAVAETGVLETTPIYRIFTADGKFENIRAARRVEVDGTSYAASSELLLSALSEHQLIRYRLNAAGELQYADTVNNYNNDETLHCTVDNKNLKYLSSARTMNGEIYVGECDIFAIPENKADEERYGIETLSSFTDQTEYTVNAYCTTSELRADVLMVVQGDPENTVNKSNPIGFVEDVYQVWDEEEGEMVYQLALWVDEESIAVTVEREDILEIVKGMSSGDACFYTMDKNGKLSGLSVIYSYDNHAVYGSGSFSSKNGVQGGYIMQKENDLIAFAQSDSTVAPTITMSTVVCPLNKTKIIQYNPKEKMNSHFSIIHANELKSFDVLGSQTPYVLMKTSYGNATYIYVPTYP